MLEVIQTVEDALEALRKAVDERGANYKYPFEKNQFGSNKMCVYGKRNDEAILEPQCIIGVIAADLGELENIHEKYEGVSVTNIFDEGVMVYSVTPVSEVAALDDRGKAAWVLAKAQNAQDNGYTWGRALGSAEQAAKQLAEYKERLSTDA